MNAPSGFAQSTPFQRRGVVTEGRSERTALSGDGPATNVAQSERVVSLAAGAILAGLGLARRDWTGLLIAAVGGALAHRGATGHCYAYESVGVDTAHADSPRGVAEAGIHVTESFLIDRPREELYNYWRDFERLPSFMSHLKSVRRIDDRRSEWTAKAPSIGGGEARWEAEITIDQPNETIAWQTLPGGAVQHHGSVRFAPALGERGTMVRIDLQYSPPGGQLGRWVAKLFGEEPQQQVRSDLRKFKHLMETGEIPTTHGQTHGSCHGTGGLLRGQ